MKKNLAVLSVILAGILAPDAVHAQYRDKDSCKDHRKYR